MPNLSLIEREVRNPCWSTHLSPPFKSFASSFLSLAFASLRKLNNRLLFSFPRKEQDAFSSKYADWWYIFFPCELLNDSRAHFALVVGPSSLLIPISQFDYLWLIPINTIDVYIQNVLIKFFKLKAIDTFLMISAKGFWLEYFHAAMWTDEWSVFYSNSPTLTNPTLFLSTSCNNGFLIIPSLGRFLMFEMHSSFITACVSFKLRVLGSVVKPLILARIPFEAGRKQWQLQDVYYRFQRII